MQVREIIPELVFGSLVVVVAIAMAIHQWRVWRTAQDDCEDDSQAEWLAFRRFRRRLQISILLGLVGAALPVGVWRPLFVGHPFVFIGFWFTVLLMIVWIVLLALSDLLSTSMQAHAIHSHLERERRSLEEELERYRREQLDEPSES